ncbi:hypothetical protein D3C87_2114900 [compost metagenome]
MFRNVMIFIHWLAKSPAHASYEAPFDSRKAMARTTVNTTMITAVTRCAGQSFRP